MYIHAHNRKMFALQSCVSQKVAFPLLISRSQGKTHAQSSSKTVSQLFYVPGRRGGWGSWCLYEVP